MRRLLGVLLVFVLTLTGQAQDRSKKAYELMYEDVQLLKVQTQRIEKRLDQASADLKTIGDLVRDLAAQFKDFQAFQARNQEGFREVPPQVRALHELLTQIESRLLLIAEDVQGLKSGPVAAAEIKDPSKAKPEANAPKAKKTDAEPAVPKTPPSGLSAQESYQAALADFDKGNFDLAIEGFALYRNQFPASPFADDALYMIGESRFSQKKFPLSIESFEELILNYSTSNKLPAAYLKKGYALAEMKKKTEAITALKFLISKYSFTEESKQAQQKIKELQDIK